MKDKILIANRGEIALRILRAARLTNLSPVMIHSQADRMSLPVRSADESVCVGPGQSNKSYMNPQALIEAARITKARYIHPGYGFLSENANFADLVEKEGFIFIGARADSIDLMGNKSKARAFMMSQGVPCIPGTAAVGIEDDLTPIYEQADRIGYPLLIKASAGGGGKGMQIVYDRAELLSQIRAVQHHALQAFHDSQVYLEKYLSHPRHLEVQVLGDGHGQVLHIGLRECSIQRRYQKIIEEAQPVNLPDHIREKMLSVALHACRQIAYRGLGTLEFLYQDSEFYFIEMNTRVQVEHPVSEMISQCDLVKLQLQVAQNERIPIKQEDIHFQGHSIECRINAEHPATYMPMPGKLKMLHAPGGFGVRFDSHLYTGAEITPLYDSMIGKIITYGSCRYEAILKMRQALSECVFDGLTTNQTLHQKILEEDDFVNGQYDTTYLNTHSFF
ncbi:MAG: acetyl-CoA carboxylase biotin carboxylase subunit [Gammaproteobacteria bacterium]|nr:acetyl-CoA carboxylase biotin carboxylase subunit [Gammaproteobacteria bacterium]